MNYHELSMNLCAQKFVTNYMVIICLNFPILAIDVFV